MDMSIHEVPGSMPGVVGWCLGAYSEVENTYVHHLKSSDGGYCFSPEVLLCTQEQYLGVVEQLYLVAEETNRLFTANQGVFFTPLLIPMDGEGDILAHLWTYNHWSWRAQQEVRGLP